jgi:hypothetical protein
LEPRPNFDGWNHDRFATRATTFSISVFQKVVHQKVVFQKVVAPKVVLQKVVAPKVVLQKVVAPTVVFPKVIFKS